MQPCQDAFGDPPPFTASTGEHSFAGYDLIFEERIAARADGTGLNCDGGAGRSRRAECPVILKEQSYFTGIEPYSVSVRADINLWELYGWNFDQRGLAVRAMHTF